MKTPSEVDTVVKVTAYLTDEAFGYEHWRAAQFSAPAAGWPALLLICKTKDDRAELARRLGVSIPSLYLSRI